jgi:hypothetical protein
MLRTRVKFQLSHSVYAQMSSILNGWWLAHYINKFMQLALILWQLVLLLDYRWHHGDGWKKKSWKQNQHATTIATSSFILEGRGGEKKGSPDLATTLVSHEVLVEPSRSGQRAADEELCEHPRFTSGCTGWSVEQVRIWSENPRCGTKRCRWKRPHLGS